MENSETRNSKPDIAAPAAASPWEPLRQPLFRAVWLASIVSNIGSTMNDTAAVWTMATMTPSPVMISLMQTMSSLPLFLLALPAGALADLVDRRQQILFAQAGALRDGAFRSSLFHDLDNPTHFRETFLVGSWAEHLRQHERATVDDKRVEEAVTAFHRGTEPPRVRHFLMTNLRDRAGD